MFSVVSSVLTPGRAFTLGLLLIATTPTAMRGLWAQQSTSPRQHIGFISFSQASPVMHVLSAVLPDELVHTVAAADHSEWDKYVRAKDAEIRQRLRGGDLDTLANLLLFGTSYTSAEVLTPALLSTIHADQTDEPSRNAASTTLLRRIDDLTTGLAHPDANERLRYFRDLLTNQQYRFETPSDLLRVKQFLGSNLVRMLHEDDAYASALEQAKRMGEKGYEKRSQVFAQRGISLDTSLFPNYAREEALREAKRRGLLPKRIARIGVIGPGLDIVNKDEGLDYYPEQTIQPFLIADTLVRMGVADAAKLQIVTFDVSEQVNHHLANASAHAMSGRGYTVQLPIRSQIPWTEGALAYWRRAGLAVGHSVAPKKSRAGAELRYKAVALPPALVAKVSPVDLDVIYQREELPVAEKLDLIFATNMFVYYGSFEQALAMENIATMLSASGLLLTNDVLPDAQGLALRSLAVSGTPYSSRPNDGDRITIYGKSSQRLSAGQQQTPSR